jgi:hypothetical protein
MILIKPDQVIGQALYFDANPFSLRVCMFLYVDLNLPNSGKHRMYRV